MKDYRDTLSGAELTIPGKDFPAAFVERQPLMNGKANLYAFHPYSILLKYTIEQIKRT
jgi:hypothetical protein